MIVNYDSENGFGTVLDNFKKQKNVLNEDTLSFAKAFNEVGNVPSENLGKLAKIFGNVDAAILNTAKDVQTGNKSMDEFNQVISKSSKQTSKFSAFTSKAGSALKSFAAGALNIAGGIGISLAISAAIGLIDDLIHRQERIIEKGEEAKKSISDTFNAFSEGKNSLDSLGKSFANNETDIKSTGDAIDSVAKKYSELYKGINHNTNENKSLTAGDYQSFIDVSNQLASQFPSLVSGYDAQGNAILNMGSNAGSAANSLRNLYDAQMLSANVEIGGNLQNAYDGVSEQIKIYTKENKSLGKTIDENKATISNLKSLSDSKSLMQSGEIVFNPDVFGSEITNFRDKLSKIFEDNGISTINEFAGEDGLTR